MSSKNKLIINCAATYVSAAEFSVANGSLVMESFKMQELNYDYSSQESWLPSLTNALKKLNVSGKANLIVPASFLLTKTIKIPHVDTGKQAEVIRFEAEKNIPYDLKEVSWSYQIISDDGIETEILLISMKLTEAEAFCAAMSSVGLVAESLEASSILDYNTWRYTQLPEDVMILNVGAKSSNLIVAREDGLFVRSIPIGGNNLTQSYADSSSKSFEEAEQLKRSAFDGNEALQEQFALGATNVMKRIGMELKRSMLNYRRKGNVAAPTKIYLSGRGSLMPNFAQYLAEDQKMDVSYLDALVNISVSAKVDQGLLSRCGAQISEMVGEAARMVLGNSVGVNLLPQRIADEMEFSAKRPMMLVAAALLAVSVLPPFMYFAQSKSIATAKLGDFTKAEMVLKDRTQELVENQEKISNLVSKVDGLKGLATSKLNWINLFIDIEECLMDQKDVWLDNMKVVRISEEEVKKYKLELTGRLLIRDKLDGDDYDSEKARARMNSLLDSFTKSRFIEAYESVTTDPTNPRILKFDFTLVINPKKPI